MESRNRGAATPDKHGLQPSLCSARIQPAPPREPESSPFWTDPACSDAPPDAVISQEDQVVAGLVAQHPGKLWTYVTGHLKVIKTTINNSYPDDTEYVRVPAFWSHIVDPVQFQHGLASVSGKEVSADGWSKDNVSKPPELLKPFDASVREPQDKIPDRNASCAAFMH